MRGMGIAPLGTWYRKNQSAKTSGNSIAFSAALRGDAQAAGVGVVRFSRQPHNPGAERR